MPGPIDPVRLCCGKPASWHVGVLCPDGKVMCQHCFDRFDVEQLYIDGEGARHDVCATCAAIEEATLRARQKLLHGE